MSIDPETRIGKTEFYEAHVPAWQANAAAIGLTEAQVAQLARDTADARTAYNQQQIAQDAAKAATEVFHNAVARMHDNGAGLIRTIKNRADTTGDPNVYVLAQIPAPAAHGPTPAPGMPTDLRVELLATGALVLSWKCPNPSGTVGTVYEVQRRIGGEGERFAYVGTTGSKSFIDETLPTGSSNITYQITAVRSTARGHAARFTVNFGVGGVGKLTANVAPKTANPDTWNVEIPVPSGKGHAYAGR